MRIVCSDYKLSFKELFDKGGASTIHQKMPKVQPFKVYKYLHDTFQRILGEVFEVNETIVFDLRMCNKLHPRNPKPVRYDTDTISFTSPKNLGFESTK